MNTRKNRTSLAGRTARLASRARGRARGAVAVALALAWSVPAVAGEGAFERALAEQARYLATEALAYEHGEGVPRDQPYAALLYTLMTVDSARRHWRGAGAAWKGRTYPERGG